MIMRKIAWIFLLILLTGAVVLVLVTQAMSPRLAPNTPAKQGGLHLENISVGKRSFQRGYVFFKDTQCIVLRVKQTLPYIRALSPSVVFYVVTPHGSTEMLPESTATASRPIVQVSGGDVVTHEVCVPLGYPDSVSYLDIVAREHPVGGKQIARWRLLNLPRSTQAIKPPVQLQHTYQCEDFEVRLEAVSEKNPSEQIVTDFGEDVLLNTRYRILRPGDDVYLNLRFTGETPQWTADGEPRMIAVGTIILSRQGSGLPRASSSSMMLPYSRYQHYVRTDAEAWVSRLKEEQRVVVLPVRPMKNRYGKTVYIAAPDKPLAIRLSAGKVTFPTLQDIKRYRHVLEMRMSATEKTSDLSISVFYQAQPTSPLDEHRVHVSLPILERGRGGGFAFPTYYFPYEEVLVTGIPASALREGVQVNVSGVTEIWVGQKHRFTLTLPIQREAE